jgi:hypothetical protein
MVPVHMLVRRTEPTRTPPESNSCSRLRIEAGRNSYVRPSAATVQYLRPTRSAPATSLPHSLSIRYFVPHPLARTWKRQPATSKYQHPH